MNHPVDGRIQILCGTAGGVNGVLLKKNGAKVTLIHDPLVQVVGVAGVFKGKQSLYELGVVFGGLLRFAVHFISGVTIYAITTSTDLFGMNFTNASLYSLVYNGSYMILNIILAVVIIFFLKKPLRKYI